MSIEIRFFSESESVEEAVLVEWLKKPGDAMRRGEVVALAETYKATIEVEAPEDGMLREIRIPGGQRFTLPAVLALMDSAGAPASPPPRPAEAQAPAAKRAPAAPAAASAAPPPHPRDADRRISPAARRRAEELGLDVARVLSAVPGRAVKVADVESFGGGARTASGAGPGAMDKDFVARLRGDCRAAREFAAQDGPRKVAALRAAGARIGEGVVLEDGCLILADHLVLGDDVRIGTDCRLEAADLAVGRMAHFEEGSRWRCRRISIGEMFYCAAETRIGWGGEWSPWAELRIGQQCFLGEQAMLNPSRRIVLEDEVAIGAGSKLYTHQFWQPVLEGYAAKHGPITVHRNVQIGANVVVLPGVSIGAGATVAANSLVGFDVKERQLVGGVPAVSLSKGPYPVPLDQAARERLVKKLLVEFLSEQDQEPGFDPGTPGPCAWRGQSCVLRFEPAWSDAASDAGGERVLVLALTGVPEGLSAPPQATVFDLERRRLLGAQDALSDRIREFLRKRGIRLTPIHWRYKHKEGVVL